MPSKPRKEKSTIGDKDELFELIQSLSKPERRYFKIHFAGTAHGDLSMYEKLFDAMAGMDQLDAAVLERKFKGWTGWKYYSKTKHYLIEAIFDAMRVYYRSKSLQESLFDQTSNLRFLNNRGLHAHFERLLQQTKTACYETEMILPLLDLLFVEEARGVRMLQEVHSVHEEIDSAMRDLKQFEDALQLSRSTFALYKKHGLRASDVVREEFQKLSQQAQQVADRTRLVYTRVTANSAVALSHHCLHEQHKAVEVTQQSIELMEKTSPRWFRHREDVYMLYLSQMVTFAFNSREAELFDSVKAYVEARLHRIENDPIKVFELEVQSSFLSMIIHRDYSTVDQNASYVDENISKFRQFSIVLQGDITFNMSLGYLKTGNLSKALEWLLRAFDIPQFEDREQIYVYARLYEILLHWKLEHTELVLAKTLSFKRFLSKRNSLGEFERVFIRFMNAAVLNDSTTGFARALANFSDDLQQLDPVQYAGITANYTELLQWFKV